MDIEFHYWITGIIAHRAGFPPGKAQIIAYASQYVDDNDVTYAVLDESTGQKYENFISQTFNILKPRAELMRIYPVFHFVPGEPLTPRAKRRDGKLHILNTTPDGDVANKLLARAFGAPQDNRLYRIGIATHAYVDTWAHQNFVGWKESFNKLGENLTPNIGHADAVTKPDRVAHEWPDTRLVEGDIVNNERFLEAAARLFDHYRRYVKSAYGPLEPGAQPWSAVETDLREAMSQGRGANKREQVKQRVSAYKALVPWLADYSESVWFGEAIRTHVSGLRDSHDGILSKITLFRDKYYWRDASQKTSTHWYQFQRAVKAHERCALTELAPIFIQMAVNIRVA